MPSSVSVFGFRPQLRRGSVISAIALTVLMSLPPSPLLGQASPAATAQVYQRGAVSGTVSVPTRKSASGITVTVLETGSIGRVDRLGGYRVSDVPPGTYTLLFSGEGFSRLRITDVIVRPGLDTILAPEEMPIVLKEGEIQRMQEVVVRAKKDVETLERLVVEDSKVKIFSDRNVDIPRGIDDVQPYYFIATEEIDHSGAMNVEELLRDKLTMNTTAYTQDQSFYIGGNRGVINLRGLGSNQTVVLINGRRSSSGGSSYGVGTQPDFNGIPLSAIDRIEILPATASAIYGGNAIGGVINIVLKRIYSGGEVRASYQNPFGTDAPIRKIDTTYGLTLEHGKSQLTLTASYADQKNLKMQDTILPGYNLRAYNNAAYSYFGYGYLGTTPNIVVSPSSGKLVLKNGTPLNSPITYVAKGITPTTSAADLAASLLANAGQRNFEVPGTNQIRGAFADVGTPSRNKSFGATLTRELTPFLDLNLEFSVASAIATRNMSITNSVSVPATAPINPFTSAVTVYLPLPGDYPVWSDNVSRRTTVGLIFKLPHEWRAEADYTWSYGTNSYSSASLLASTDLTAAFNAGTINPFVDTAKYPVNLAPYIGYQSYTGGGGTNNLGLRAGGPVWHLPGGAPTANFGLETRREGFGDAFTYGTYANFPARNTLSQTLGKRQTADSAYAETLIPVVSESNHVPLVRAVELQLAARRENYTVNTGTASVTLLPVPATAPTILSNQGHFHSTNTTIGLSYRPLRSVLFRTSYGEGFVAPTPAQLLYNPTLSTSQTQINDPKRGGSGYGIYTTGGGNPNLKPETSKNWNAGLVLEPTIGWLRGFRFDVEYSFIQKRNNISTLSAQQTLDNEAIYPDRVTRAAVAAGDPYGVGQVTTISTAYLNVYKAYTETFDLSASYRRETPHLGTFTFSSLATITNHFKQKTTYAQPMVDYAGFTGYALKQSANASLNWDFRRWTVALTSHYYSQLKVYGPPLTTSTVYFEEQGGATVPSQIYTDLFVAYRFKTETERKRVADRLTRGLEIQIGVTNLFKQIPPFDTSSFGSYPYSTYGDIRLRQYRFVVKKAL